MEEEEREGKLEKHKGRRREAGINKRKRKGKGMKGRKLKHG